MATNRFARLLGPNPSNAVSGTQLGKPATLPSQNAMTSTQLSQRPVRPKPRPKPKPKPKPKPSTGSSTRPRPSTPPSRGSGSNAGSGTANGASVTVRRPLTFRGADGQIHRTSQRFRNGQPAPRPARPGRPKVDPLEKLVDDMIAGSTKPYENDKKALVEQSAGDVNQLNRLHEFYDGQVGAVRDDATADFGSMLARAAELKGISADTIAKNQGWLRSLAGPSNGGTLDAQVAQSGAETLASVQGANDSLARDIQSQGQALNDTMAQLQVSGRAAQRDAVQQELLRRQAGVREIDRGIAEMRAKRPEMLYQMRQAEQDARLKQQVAEAEWGLKTAQAQSLDNYRQGQLALGAARLQNDISEGSATKPPAPGRYGNIPKRYDSAIKSVWTDLNRRFNSEDGLPAPWRTAHQALVDQGLNPTSAAFLATMWFKDSITSSTPENIRTMLANRGVSTAAQRRIINQHFGPRAWGSIGQNLMGMVGDFVNDATGR
jgi:hypothetical protein